MFACTSLGWSPLNVEVETNLTHASIHSLDLFYPVSCATGGDTTVYPAQITSPSQVKYGKQITMRTDIHSQFTLNNVFTYTKKPQLKLKPGTCDSFSILQKLKGGGKEGADSGVTVLENQVQSSIVQWLFKFTSECLGAEIPQLRTLISSPVAHSFALWSLDIFVGFRWYLCDLFNMTANSCVWLHSPHTEICFYDSGVTSHDCRRSQRANHFPNHPLLLSILIDEC